MTHPSLSGPLIHLELNLTGPELVALIAAAVAGTNAVALPPPSQVKACAKLMKQWDKLTHHRPEAREQMAEAIDWHSYAMEISRLLKPKAD